VHQIVLDRSRIGPPRAPETVMVTRDRSRHTHRVVAFLSVEENMRVDFDEAVREANQLALLRARAARLGCDAIAVSRADSLRCARNGPCYERYGHRAECLVWRNGDAR
jgi:hypothetical protein